MRNLQKLAASTLEDILAGTALHQALPQRLQNLETAGERGARLTQDVRLGHKIALARGDIPKDRMIRIGGLVEEGSVQRDKDALTVRFRVTDTAKTIPVTYTGILPDLFKEGKGVVAQGRLGPDGTFKASEVLAMVADEAIQIHGGMGLMDDLPLERIWRDARVERIWEGTSEIQRHIISRELLRAVGG